MLLYWFIQVRHLQKILQESGCVQWMYGWRNPEFQSSGDSLNTDAPVFQRMGSAGS